MVSIRQSLKAAALSIPVALASPSMAQENDNPSAQQTIETNLETLSQQVGDALYYVLGYHLDGANLKSDAKDVDVTFCREYVDNDFKEGLVACLQEITEIAEKLGERAETTLDRGNYFGVIDNANQDVAMVRTNIQRSCYAYEGLLNDLRTPNSDKEAVLEDIYVKLSNCFDFSLLVLRKSEQSTLQEKSERFIRLSEQLLDEDYTAPDRLQSWLQEYPFDASLEDYIKRPRWFIDPPEIFGWKVPSPIATLNTELPSCDQFELEPDNQMLGLSCLIEMAPVAKNYGTFARDRLEYDYIGQDDETPAAEWQTMVESYARVKGHCYGAANITDSIDGNLDEGFINLDALRNRLAHDIRLCFKEANGITEARRAQRISEIASEYDEIAEALAFESFYIYNME